MKYSNINSELFIYNRQNFIKKLKSRSLAIFNANDEYTRSGDQNYNFKQNPDLYYLSGIDQEQTVLILFPDCPNPIYREVLFIRQTNEHIAVWEGYKYTKEQAKQVSGIQTILWIEDFWNIFPSIMHYANNVYLNTNENDRYAHTVPNRDIRFIEEMKSKFPLHHYERASVIMRELRPIKSKLEIELTKKACEITRDAFIRVLKFVKPGIKEYEIEAEIIHEFIRQGATGHAYSPIIASGKNACILHYNDNNQVCNNGDVILFDFAAEYANYNADLSRSIPVNGRFTKRQKEVYKSVLYVLKEATKMLVQGTIWNDYHDEVGKIMTSELLKLGLLDKHDIEKQNPAIPAYKKYFMHGTSHHLGLDVHDISDRYKPFEEGNILTCEPGIYILQENLGIRLENDILITSNGPVNLMADIPLELEEIEEIMNS